MVLTVQATPSAVLFPSRFPMAKASLILNCRGAAIWPLPISQEGMLTQESRGMDMTSAHCRFAAMCTIIVVSDWSVVRFRPNAALSPNRLSEPISRMFSAFGCRSTGWLPSSPLMSRCWMLPFRCRYSRNMPMAARATTPAVMPAVQMRTFRRLVCGEGAAGGGGAPPGGDVGSADGGSSAAGSSVTVPVTGPDTGLDVGADTGLDAGADTVPVTGPDAGPVTGPSGRPAGSGADDGLAGSGPDDGSAAAIPRPGSSSGGTGLPMFTPPVFRSLRRSAFPGPG